MKFIKEYNRFTETRTEPVDIGDKNILEYLEEVVPWYVENMRNIIPIYRGLRSEYKGPKSDRRYLKSKKLPWYKFSDLEWETQVLKVAPSKFERRAANTDNMYIDLMDNSPYWEGYPKRSESIICTTESERAWVYSKPGGSVYLVIPLQENSKIAVCPTRDIFEAFQYLYKKVDGLIDSHQIYDIPSFNQWLFRTFRFDPNESNFETLKHQMKITGDAMESGNISSDSYTDSLYNAVELGEMHTSDFLGDIEEWMNPKDNKFDLIEYNRNTGESGDLYRREVWTDADCLLIPNDKIKELYRLFKEKESISKG